MILWLASYPRSGNTYLRTVLNTCFGLNTYSIYNDKSDIGKTNSFSSEIGHKSYPGSWSDFYKDAVLSDEVFPIKTHDAPFDNGKAIYVVRDPCASIVSFYHYLLQYSRYKADLYDVISGAVSYGGWSQHFKAWSPKTRANTLFLKFEDLTAKPDEVIERIAEFTGLQVKGGKPPTFADLQSKFPEFFRSGSNKKNTEELTSDQLSFLKFFHEETIEELGYYVPGEYNADALRKAIGLQSEKLLQFRLTQMAQFAIDLGHIKHLANRLTVANEADHKILVQSESRLSQISKQLGEFEERYEKRAAEKEAEIKRLYGLLKNKTAEISELKAVRDALQARVDEMSHVLDPNMK